MSFIIYSKTRRYFLDSFGGWTYDPKDARVFLLRSDADACSARLEEMSERCTVLGLV